MIGKCINCTHFINSDCKNKRLPTIGSTFAIENLKKHITENHILTQNEFINMVNNNRYCIDFKPKQGEM